MPEIPRLRISVVIPSYLREETLVGTVQHAVAQLSAGDELILVDQTPRHEEATETALTALSATGSISWVRKTTPSICEAMNVGALLASGDVIVFLDDDTVPTPTLLDTYRRLFSGADAPLSACGQVLQPSDEGPSSEPGDFELAFNFAYSEPAEITGIIAMNFAVRRDVFLAIGGMDEAFRGGAHRCDAEIGFRLLARTGQRTRFVPEASVRHLHAPGGTRAHGHKDSWRALESAVGDHYFGMRCLSPARSLFHSARRLARAPVSRNAFRKPWLVFSVLAREIVAWWIAVRRSVGIGGCFVRELRDYIDLVSVSGAGHGVRRPATARTAPRALPDV